jgi:hypothetical protein
VQERQSKSSSDEKKHDNGNEDDDDDTEHDRGHNESQSAKNSMKSIKKRQPLRIDMRNNNPEQEAIEKLLESNEYSSRTGMHCSNCLVYYPYQTTLGMFLT